MRTSVLAGVIAMALLSSGCGAEPSTNAKPAKLTPADGPHPTIADYIRANKITEDQIHHGDSGKPKIELPSIDGWKSTGDDNPQWAYDSIIPTGSAAGYPPSIAVLLSKLTGAVDAQALLAAAPGELQNLPDFTASAPGTAGSLGGFPAYQIAGTWRSDGKTKYVAQKTVVFPANGATYVVQLNTDGPADQATTLDAVTAAVDRQTKITM